MPVSLLLLCLSIALVWAPHAGPQSRVLRWMWLSGLAAALIAALIQEVVAPVGLAGIALMLGLCLAATPKARRGPRGWQSMPHPLGSARQQQQAWWLVAALLVGLALSLHLLPGFDNPSYAVRLSDTAPPQLKYLNFDKGVAGLLLVMVLVRQQEADGRTAPWRRTGLGPLLAVVLLTLAVPWGLAVLSGQAQPNARWPDNAALFLGANLFLTCVAEEAAFRGVVQGLLARQLSPGPGHGLGRLRGWIPVLVSTLLFGLAHAGGGPAYIALASVAGLGYGLAYALTRRLEVAMALHFALNALVFLTLDVKLG